MKIETKEAMRLFEKKGKGLITKLRNAERELKKNMLSYHSIIASHSLEREQEDIAAQAMSRQYESIARLSEDIRRYFSSLRSAANLCGISSLSQSIQNTVTRSIRESGIEAYNKEGTIVLKTPHPINRYSRSAAGAINTIEIREALSAVEKSSIIGLPVLVCFWHVYPQQEGIAYPDNDNYLVKSIIDQICEALGVRDDGTNMFLFHATVTTDMITEGTYILIGAQDCQTLDFVQKNKVLDFLSSIQFRPAFQGPN